MPAEDLSCENQGDAEFTLGDFRSRQEDADSTFCATNWCVFDPTAIPKELVDAQINIRLHAINATGINLLQFHWQDCDDHQYVEAAMLIESSPRVRNLGLCNFDTLHRNEILESGVNIVSNQVQVSDCILK